MSNYNERLDEVLTDLRSGTINFDDKAKHALTSLIKELVTESKPEEYEDYYATNPVEKGRKMGYNEAAREFEQNLLKALEE